MRIAVGSDEKTGLTEFVIRRLKEMGHEVGLFGALLGKETPWPRVGQEVAEKVASGEYDEGILFCWTGTGVSIAANKVPGIRAALCVDAKTAKGERIWNHANILVMSLRYTSEAIANEILDAWFSTPYDERERKTVEMVKEIELKYSRTKDA